MTGRIRYDSRSAPAPLTDPEWWDQAACRGTWMFEAWFPDRSTKYPEPMVQQICDSCPVRVKCLSDALRRRDPWGIRGGTTGWQREQILRGRSRRQCPFCASQDIRRQPKVERCMSCGISWLAATA